MKPAQSDQSAQKQRYNNIRFYHLEGIYGTMTVDQALALAESHEQLAVSCRSAKSVLYRNSVDRLLEYACLIEAGYPNDLNYN